jgi:hypothetical protein
MGSSLAMLACAAAPALAAQAVREPAPTAYPHFGLQAGIADRAELGVGARYENRMRGMFPEAPNLRFALSFDYFFPDSPLSYWEVNANVFNLFRSSASRIVPYAGGGLNIARTTNGRRDTDLGINVLGGVRLPGSYRPYLEARVELGGGDQFVVTLGWLFW